MLHNYLKSALRNFLQHKGFFIINVVGLAVGIAVCLLLFFWVHDEWSYDRFHAKADRIFRVTSWYEADGMPIHHAYTPAPLAPALLSEFPEVERAVRIYPNIWLVGYESKRFYEKVFFADPEVFDVFTFPLVRGDPATALLEPRSVVISEAMSRKYFGDEDPLGKTLIFSEERNYIITGVMEDLPPNSHFHFDALASFRSFSGKSLESWGISNYKTYILVREGFSVKSFAAKMPGFVEKYKGRESRYIYKTTFPLQHLTSIHLHSHLRGEIEPNREVTTLYIFSAMALLILFIACLNYINLSSARLVRRAKEVGMRKAIGANRSQLVWQYLSESFLLCLLALCLAVALAELTLPLFNFLSGKTLSFQKVGIIPVLVSLVLILILVGLSSGLAPAFSLSSLKPVNALKGIWREGHRASRWRRFAVVSQFTLSIIFLVATFTIFTQLNYMRNKKLGFDKEHIVSLPLLSKEAREAWPLLKLELLSVAGVQNVSASSFTPGGLTWYQNYWYEGLPENQAPMIRWLPVDHDFLETFRINLVSGRDFSTNFPADVKGSYILNESAVKMLGWTSPLGRTFKIIEKGTVIGIVEDFHFSSLHKAIEPMALYVYPEACDHLMVRLGPGRIPRVLDELRKKWERLIPTQDFEFTFFDEDLDRLYRSEMRLGTTFVAVTVLAVFVACLGLFGLAAFTSNQRTKEVGIRKVLGASTSQIYFLLCREFTGWVLAANILAWPVAYYAMQKWLQGFAYRAGMGMWPFFGAASVILAVALLTVSYQSLKAALANPVDSLRYE